MDNDVTKKALKKTKHVADAQERLQAVKSLMTPPPPAFSGFPDYSTPVLEHLRGKATTSRQEIENLSKMGTIRQAEKDLISKALATYQKEVPVSEFASKVHQGILPLKVTPTDKWSTYGHDEVYDGTTDSKSNVYESPYPFASGHFPEEKFPNYFAHTRTADLGVETTFPSDEEVKEEFKKLASTIAVREDPDYPGSEPYAGFVNGERSTSHYATEEEARQAAESRLKSQLPSTLVKKSPATGRRLLEIQSDLFQKGNESGFNQQYGQENLVAAQKQLKEEEQDLVRARDRQEGFPKVAQAFTEGKLDSYIEGENKPTADSDYPRISEEIAQKIGVSKDVAEQFLSGIARGYNRERFAHDFARFSNPEYAEFAQDIVKRQQEIVDRAKQKVTALQQKGDSTQGTLDTYKNTWAERILQEEVKRAASEGISEYHVPTGSTAAISEGYLNYDQIKEGREEPSHEYDDAEAGNTVDIYGTDHRVLDTDGSSLQVVPESSIQNEFGFDEAVNEEGDNRGEENYYELQHGDEDMLERFKESLSEDDQKKLEDNDDDLKKAELEDKASEWAYETAHDSVNDRYANADDFAEQYSNDTGQKYFHIGNGKIIVLKDEGEEPFWFDPDDEDGERSGEPMTPEEVREELSGGQRRVFDFYEKDLPKIIKRFYPDAEKITDDKGLEWLKIPVKPEHGKLPVSAFGSFDPQVVRRALGMMQKETAGTASSTDVKKALLAMKKTS